MKRIIIYLLTAISLFLVGCEVERFAPIQTLQTECSSLVAPGIGASYTLSVSSNTSWKARLTEEGWVSCDIEEFVGSASVNVVFASNDGGARSCELVLSTEDGSITRSVILRQGSRTEDGLLSIAQLRSHEAEGEYVFTESSKIRGFVTTDLEGNNFYPNSFAMQDGFGSDATGITVTLAQTQPEFVRGDEVEIELEGATLKRNEHGVLALTPAKTPVRIYLTGVFIISEKFCNLRKYRLL